MVMASLMVLTACTRSDGADRAGDSADMMAVALQQLVAEDNTFGDGPPPFTEYLIQASTDPAAGSAVGRGPSRPLTDAERSAIEVTISKFGPVQWIDDPDDWRNDDLTPTIDGAVILGVGEPEIDGDTALVPVSLWCGGTCGTWFTYRLDFEDGGWSVRGMEGPITVS